MKKEGIQTRKRKPKNSHGPTKEPKSSKSSNNSSSNMQHNMQSLGSSHQYPTYDSARDAAAKAILNYETGELENRYLHIKNIL